MFVLKKPHPLAIPHKEVNTEDTPVLHFQKLSPLAVTLSRHTPHSAGLDLYSPVTDIIERHCQKLIITHLRFVMQHGFFWHLATNSSVAYSKTLVVCAGVVDYDGNVRVLLHNYSSDKSMVMNRGNLTAQFILENICISTVKEIEVLPHTRCTSSFNTFV